MSLQIWLPLNGNLNNQGLSNVTATNHGATVGNNGKIGKCYQNTASNYITIPVTINVKQPFSLCYWYRIDTWKDWGTTITLNTANEDYVGMCPSSNGTSIGTNWYELRNGTSTRIFDSYHSNTITVGQWNHIAIIFDGINNIKTYINGILVSNGTVATSPLANFTELTLFRRGRNATYGHSSLNDVRVYDHALSTKEVQELAKGLVLHYRLAGPGQENLIKASGPNEDGWGINQSGGAFTKTITSECTSFEVTTQATSWFLYYHKFSNLSSVGLKPNTQYTYSFDCKSNQSFTLNIKLLKGNGTSYLTNTKDVRIEGDNEWHRYKVTLTTNATLDISDQYFYMTGGNVLSKTHFRYAKFEEGPIATPWTPHPSDTLWTTMGYSNNIEYDCSGFGYNGTKGDNIIWDANSARYTTSYKFDNKDRISMPDIPFQNFKEGTFSIWLKVNSYGIWTHYAFFANGFNWTGQGIDSIIIANHSASTNAVILDCCSYTSQHSLALNTWNLCTITWDKNYQIKKYVNGQLIATHDDSVNKRLDTYMTKHGTCGLGNVTQSDSNKGDFNLTDCRIYATALSAAAIEELYHSAVIVDNSGKTYAYEYFEG